MNTGVHSERNSDRNSDRNSKKNIPDENELFDLAELFKVFGDSTRIRILYALYDEERSVSDIAESLNMTQSAVSHQLKTLRNSRLIRYRREGKVVYYSLDDEHIGQVLLQGMLHLSEL